MRTLAAGLLAIVASVALANEQPNYPVTHWVDMDGVRWWIVDVPAKEVDALKATSAKAKDKASADRSDEVLFQKLVGQQLSNHDLCLKGWMLVPESASRAADTVHIAGRCK